MQVIKSNELGQTPVTFGEEAGRMKLYDSLETPFCDGVVRLSPEHGQQITAFACAAATEYGDKNGAKELTLSQTRNGVPALVTRVD